MKYIIADVEIKGERKELPFLFSRDVNHSDMAEPVRVMRYNSLFAFNEIVSGGFVSEAGKCYGRSESLNINSRKEDTDILKSEMGRQW